MTRIFLFLIYSIFQQIPAWAEAPLDDDIPIIFEIPAGAQKKENTGEKGAQYVYKIGQKVYPITMQKITKKRSIWPKIFLGTWMASGIAGGVALWLNRPLGNYPLLKRYLPLIILGYGMVLSALWANFSSSQIDIKGQLRNGGNRFLQLGIDNVVSIGSRLLTESITKSLLG